MKNRSWTEKMLGKGANSWRKRVGYKSVHTGGIHVWNFWQKTQVRLWEYQNTHLKHFISFLPYKESLKWYWTKCAVPQTCVLSRHATFCLVVETSVVEMDQSQLLCFSLVGCQKPDHFPLQHSVQPKLVWECAGLIVRLVQSERHAQEGEHLHIYFQIQANILYVLGVKKWLFYHVKHQAFAFL